MARIVAVLWLPERRIVVRTTDLLRLERLFLDEPDVGRPERIVQNTSWRILLNGVELPAPRQVRRFQGRQHLDVEHLRLLY